ncbi:MAG TPA: hypothetical protein VF072_16220 [Thermoleophilaceae bacterium]
MIRATSDRGAGAEGAAIAVAGRAATVFDWSSQACAPENIPDLPVRAFRDHRGRVQLILAHDVNRRMVGPTLDHVRVDCAVTMRSTRNPDPAAFDDAEWIGSVFTRDGRRVAALVHEEYHGARPGICDRTGGTPPCWYNAVTLARSDDGGRSFEPRPGQLVAASTYRYRPRAAPTGIFTPSNIVGKGDGYYYALVVSRAPGGATGSCLIRSPDPFVPSSWRAWDGEAFRIRFANPYRVTPGAALACTPVARSEIVEMHESLTYNTYLDRYLLVGLASLPGPSGKLVTGVYFSLSRDLIHWTSRRLMMKATVTHTFRCGGADPIAYPSLIDPRSHSRTFATTGRRPYLYLTRFNYEHCRQSLDRDLVRLPVEISK